MAKVFRTPRKVRNKDTGKLETARDADGKPLLHPKWRVSLINHKGKRKTCTLSPTKLQAQKQADMLELREREIRNGLRPPPEPESGNRNRDFNDVFDEYMAWGEYQGGRGGLPWDDEHAIKKRRDLLFWRDTLGLKIIGDAEQILPKVEAECRKMSEAGNNGKTIANKIQHLHAMLLWCRRRQYLETNPLAELGRFDIKPTFVRRAITREEYRRLIDSCEEHRRLLYEVAVMSGLRENELKQLEPRHLDHVNCAIHIERMIDKGRIERRQVISSQLMERLTAFSESGEAKKLYKRFRCKGEYAAKAAPKNPLLYVSSNPARSLKKDLMNAGVEIETQEGRLDFHALRTAYINFLLELGAAPKEVQDLARHKTLEMTMNTYGRSRQERKRSLVEELENMLSGTPHRGKSGDDTTDESSSCAAHAV